jgi:diadenosine tetraphosphate (Ap4A) HIT family hydrolase
MHDTAVKFGFPDTLIKDYSHWVLLLRPQQCTLGASVLVAKSEATSFSDLPVEAFTEMSRVVSDIERVLKARFDFKKINYLMLMMVDPQCHFHVLPRYAVAQHYMGAVFADAGWPGPPDLKSSAAIGDQVRDDLILELRGLFAAC